MSFFIYQRAYLPQTLLSLLELLAAALLHDGLRGLGVLEEIKDQRSRPPDEPLFYGNTSQEGPIKVGVSTMLLDFGMFCTKIIRLFPGLPILNLEFCTWLFQACFLAPLLSLLIHILNAPCEALKGTKVQ